MYTLGERLVRLLYFPALGCLCVVAGSGCAPTVARGGTYINLVRPDQHPPLVGTEVAADSLWGPMAESPSGNGIAASRRADLQALVERFAPTLILPNNDNVEVAGSRFWMLPTNVSLYADTLRVDYIRAAPFVFEDSVDIPLRTISPDSLAQIISAAQRYESDPERLAYAYFDFPGISARQWWEAYGRFRTGPDSARWATPTVYAHPFIEPKGRLAIQYWFFYPVNDFIGNHEGDWEHIIVIASADHQSIEEVHYYFHQRSLVLPQRGFTPDTVDGTHPVVHVGGRMYYVGDYPIRLLSGDHNEGSHGSYPFVGEWEGATGTGEPESVQKVDAESLRVVPWRRFDVVLTPEPGRIDYRRRPEVLREWAWLLLPVRWGFPVSTSAGSALHADLVNLAPYGPAFSTAWNRTAPGLLFSAYTLRRIPTVESYVEDVLQPWYWLYIFRTPRYVHDTRDTSSATVQEQLGLLPRSGWREKGFGTTALGLSFIDPSGGFGDAYQTSKGFLIWRNLWMKLRVGLVELTAGYQRFEHQPGTAGTFYVYPITAALVIRAPSAKFRPYVGAGGGIYGWQTRAPTTTTRTYLASSGWDLGWNLQAGIEYYMRPTVALDVGLRLNEAHLTGASASQGSDHLRFLQLWVGHYLRF